MMMIRRVIWAFSLLVLMASCSLVDSPEVPCPDAGGKDDIRMSFQMISGNIRPTKQTRTDSEDHEEVESEWPAFEDAIYERDFAFYVFLGDGEDAPLVLKVADITNSGDPFMMITGSPGSYTVTATIKRKSIEDALGRELDPNSDNSLDFRIVVLANTKKDYDGVNCKTYKDLIDAAGDWSFDMDDIYSPNDGVHVASGIYKNYIPMFGTKIFSVTEKALDESRPDDRIWLGEIWMLRSLAKVRVIDAIKDKQSGLPRIESAEVIGTTSTVRPLPYNAIAYQDGTQVHTPNIVANPSGDSRTNGFFLGTLVDGSMLRIGYLPEQAIGKGNPVIRLTVTFQLNAQGTPVEQEIYDVPMDSYNGVNFTFGDNILRNHIYTLQVDGVKRGVAAEITLNVADWTEQSLDLDYSDQVGIANGGNLQWTAGTYQNDNQTTGELVVLPWHDGAPVAATATFGLATPVNAEWIASLITETGEQGAFKFVDADGNQVETVSGTVNGKLATLRIVTTNATPTQNNSARLQVVVKLANGKYMEAPVGQGTNYRNYTIIQNSL